jgi:hypothetical protein
MVAALTAATHRPAVVMTAPTAVPRSLSRQIRDTRGPSWPACTTRWHSSQKPTSSGNNTSKGSKATLRPEQHNKMPAPNDLRRPWHRPDKKSST